MLKPLYGRAYIPAATVQGDLGVAREGLMGVASESQWVWPVSEG